MTPRGVEHPYQQLIADCNPGVEKPMTPRGVEHRTLAEVAGMKVDWWRSR